MNRKAIVLTGIAVISLAAAAGQGVMLRRELKENATEVYSIKTEMKQSLTIGAMGDQELAINSSMKLTLKTGKLDATTGEAGVESVITDIKTETDGVAAMMGDQAEVPKEIKSTGTLDARNRIKLAAPKTQGLVEMMLGSSSPTSALMFIEFPEKAVNVGDTWTVTLPKSPAYGNKEQTLTAKLESEKEVDGTKVWVLSLAGKIKLDFDMTEMMKSMPNNPMAGQKATMKGDIDLTGEALVDKSNCKTIRCTTNSKTKNTVTLEDVGMTIDASGTAKTTLSLQK